MHAKDLIAKHSHELSHGHGHTPPQPAAAPVRRLLLILLLPLVAATVIGAIIVFPFNHDQKTGAQVGLNQVPVQGDVRTVTKSSCVVSQGQASPDQSSDPSQQCFKVTVAMTDGPAAGREVDLTVPDQGTSLRFTAGDHVVLSYAGGDPSASQSYQLVDFQRGPPLLLLGLLFVVAVLVFGRWRGLAALGALAISFAVLVYFIFPTILSGESPLLAAIIGAGLIMFAVLYLTHGFSARTSTAVLGTLVSLVVIGALGAAFSLWAKLTGLDDSTANLVTILGHGIDTRGLLLAATIIGALGVMDDITVTQTSAVWELRRANPELSFRQLYAAGARIGRDHLASVVNTLVMAYMGAALPLMLAFSLSGRSFSEIVTSQEVALEIVRTLVGTIGLIAALPITTALAAAIANREPRSTELSSEAQPAADLDEFPTQEIVLSIPSTNKPARHRH